MKSVAVLGLGKYGRSLAKNLYSMGADVLAVDKDEVIIEEISHQCTSAICANLENEDEVTALGLKNMDIVVTAMGTSMGASIMAVSVAKEQGVPFVVSKAASERMSSILKKVGADKIINPEGEGGLRSASILISSSFTDFFEIDSNMYMIEMKPRKEWIGKNLMELELRRKMNLNVVAIRESGKLWTHANPKFSLTENCVLLIVVEKKDMKNVQD
ncbi:TrkA family potassium uptake protein [Ruminococcus sp. HUN007]|jgi:trk system potassium uptake protein TrkA|uniref:potassium channel family protein n=1 Tax=Ruminococcus sp. HUN007 TaxID=1514668 RepID=UPI0005D1BACC|nr:TrkA family potassium uptake protein [Ruminococcus sp. HUN007]